MPRHDRARALPFSSFLIAAVLLAAALLPRVAAAQPWKEFEKPEPLPHLGTMVTLKVRGDAIQAYLVIPEGRGPHAGVVVIHEWWGLNDQIRGVADRLGAMGYAAIVPDLYRGKIPKDAGLAHELMRALNEDWAVDAIRSAGQYLRSNSDVRAPAVGTIGFCMGGRLSLAAALKMVPIQAAVMYYGSVETDVQSLVPLKVPLLGIFGRDDHGISEQDVRRFEKALIQAGKQATILIYPGAGHAFFNEQRASYVREASNDAWERTRIFLDEHLRKQEPPRERIAPREPRIDR